MISIVRLRPPLLKTKSDDMAYVNVRPLSRMQMEMHFWRTGRSAGITGVFGMGNSPQPPLAKKDKQESIARGSKEEVEKSPRNTQSHIKYKRPRSVKRKILNVLYFCLFVWKSMCLFVNLNIGHAKPYVCQHSHINLLYILFLQFTTV